MKTQRRLAGSAALLVSTALGCNLILGTEQPLPEGAGGGGGGGGGGGSTAAPCDSDEWTHWSPTAAHTFEVVKGSDGHAYVTDALTGLDWQAPPPAAENAVSWSAAGAYCKGLTWGGITGYRLPTVMELASLTRYDLAAPAMDPALSPGASAAFWTGSASHAEPGAAWIIAYGGGQVSWKEEDGTSAVRCVHDRKPAPDLTCARYTLVDGGYAVRDEETGLSWQRKQSSGPVRWSDAKAACGALPADGSAKWRLPEVAELLTLLDVDGTDASGLDPQFFAGEPADFYWTATVDASAPSANAWSVNTHNGATGPAAIALGAYARCVR